MGHGIAMRVALAITESCNNAGQSFSSDDIQDAKARANNLISNNGPHAPYILPGDPYGWSEGALATILMEPRGTRGDCSVPIDYYGNGREVAHQASERLKDCYIEFVNTAVAVVYGA